MNTPITRLILAYALGIICGFYFGFSIWFSITLCFALLVGQIFARRFEVSKILLLALLFWIGVANCQYHISKISAEKDDQKLNPIIASIQERITAIGKQVVPGAEGNLMLGLVFGSKSAKLDWETKENYRQAGLSHLLVASGMQVSLLAAVAISMLAAIWPRKGLQFALASILVCFYGLLAGLGWSIIRSLIMIEVALVSKLLLRSVARLQVLLLSAFIILVIDPAAIFNAGFQLTFAATWSLMELSRLIQEKFQLKTFSEVIAPILATFPISAYWFNQISLVSFVSNMVVLPVISFLTIFGMVTVIVGAIFLPLGQVLGLSLGGMLFILNQLVALLSHLPYAAIVCAKISPVNIVIYYFSLWYFLLPKERRAALLGNSFKEYQLILALGIIAAFIQFYPAMASVVDPKGLTIELLDVGQGDSILVRSNDHAFLVDGGDRYMGGRLLSYLVKRKIKKLDFVVLTHPHDDHVGGLLKTLENFQVDQVFDDGEGAEYGENSPVSESYRRFLELIRQNNIKYSRLFAGTNLIWQDKVKIEVVNPPNFSCKPPDKNLNNNSIAFRLLYGNFSMLFTGDMEEPAEKAVLCSNYPLDSLVLKVGHHGSRTATSSKFLGLINPQFAAISAGHSNRFHHPHAATLRKLELAGAKVLRTDQLGTIQIFTDGRAWKIDHLQ